ncbi:putative signal transducing protein [Nitrospira sp. Kam-Ns4a]
MVKLIEPQDVGELALIKSLLDGNGIAYFVRNEHLGSLLPGVPFAACAVMVEEWDLDRAGTLLGRLAPAPRAEEVG